MKRRDFDILRFKIRQSAVGTGRFHADINTKTAKEDKGGIPQTGWSFVAGVKPPIKNAQPDFYRRKVRNYLAPFSPADRRPVGFYFRGTRK